MIGVRNGQDRQSLETVTDMLQIWYTLSKKAWANCEQIHSVEKKRKNVTCVCYNPETQKRFLLAENEVWTDLTILPLKFEALSQEMKLSVENLPNCVLNYKNMQGQVWLATRSACEDCARLPAASAQNWRVVAPRRSHCTVRRTSRCLSVTHIWSGWWIRATRWCLKRIRCN